MGGLGTCFLFSNLSVTAIMSYNQANFHDSFSFSIFLCVCMHIDTCVNMHARAYLYAHICGGLTFMSIIILQDSFTLYTE